MYDAHTKPPSPTTSSKNTQSRHDDARGITKGSLVYTSYNNLVALANAQEGLMESGKKLVWRDPGEPPEILETLEECVVYALRGGFREQYHWQTTARRWLTFEKITQGPPV